MSFEKLKEVLTNIKAHYQNFSVNHYVVEEWYKVLKDYDFDDVMNNLVDHLTSDKASELPMPYQLVRHLIPKDKKQNYSNYNRYIVACNLCDRWMNLLQHEKHYDKCLQQFCNKNRTNNEESG